MFIFYYEQKASNLINVKAMNAIVCFIDKIAILIILILLHLILLYIYLQVVLLLYLLSNILLWYNNVLFYLHYLSYRYWCNKS